METERTMVNSNLARIYGSDNDCIYLAPLGTTLPTDIDGPLDAAFERRRLAAFGRDYRDSDGFG